ncbi:hypothetical protein ACLOJK_009459 [Asimina triloba]
MENGMQKHRKLSSDSASELPPEAFARNYQLEALEKAKKENTIVFLETGSGKTLIAVMLLRHYTHELRKPSKFIAVFLVPTVVLVSQQAKVLELHTDLKVGKFWGDMGVDFWDAKTWTGQLDEFEILLDNLRHSFFKLDQIKLLIFDECHHARGRSPYACIMTDEDSWASVLVMENEGWEFYHRNVHRNSPLLPRIFGMTASPVNSKGSSLRAVYAKRIMELETLMNSKVYTVANEAVLAEFVPFSTPKLKFYDHVDMPYGLHQSLVDTLKALKTKVEPHLKHLRSLQGTVFCNIAMESMRKKLAKLFQTYLYCLDELGLWPAMKAAETLSSSEADIFFWGQLRDADADRKNVVARTDCVIISGAERRIGNDLKSDIDSGYLTAKVECLIQSLVEYRCTENLRCIVFVERVISAIVLKAVLSQVSRLSCWNTTYMAGNQSGLQCQTRNEQIKIVDAFRDGAVNIIVATSILEEVGKAARPFGDSATHSRVANYLASGDILHEESIKQASIPCPLLDTEMCHEDFYCVETTGAVVTLRSSIALIYFYCSRLPSDGLVFATSFLIIEYFSPRPRFETDEEAGFCTIHLPKSCPIGPISVQGHRSILKQIACLEACKQLHKIGIFTDSLLPEMEEPEDPDDEETGIVSSVEEQAAYFPGELVGQWPSFTEESFHCYSLVLKKNFRYDVPFRDISLIVRCNLGSDLASSSFQMEVDRGSLTVNVDYVGTIHLNAEQVHLARKFQTAVLRILIDHNLSKLKNALYGLHPEDKVSRVAYLLLPSVKNQKSLIIDWESVKESVRSLSFPTVLAPSPAVVGRRNGFQGFHLPNELCRSVQTNDAAVCSCILKSALVFTPHNVNAECFRCISRQFGYELQTFAWFLGKASSMSVYESTNVVELPPELCVVIMAPVSISTWYSFSFVPSIMHRIEALLLAIRSRNLQMNHYTQNVIVPATKVLEALTTKTCQEEFSLESLETLGDSFLKYAASQQLFRDHKDHHEGLLSTKKDKMISNNTLFALGCKRELQGFIRNECFDPKHWTVPGDYSGYFWEEEMFSSMNIYKMGTRNFKRKVVADVVEALIGAYLSTTGELSALIFMEWLGMRINFVNKMPDDRPLLVKPETYVNVSHLESLLKYSFHDRSLLVEALTHGSYLVPEVPRCYQRLEFLGDSVLDYLITVHMYNKFPGLSPGLLTDLRSASANNDCYGCAAVAAEDIANRVQHLAIVLGDVIESIAGAILIDSGFDKDIVWESIRPLLEPLVTPATIKYHPVKELEYLCTKRSYKMKFYRTIVDGIASVTAEVNANGVTYRETKTADNKRDAKKSAAKSVLELLKANIPGLWRLAAVGRPQVVCLTQIFLADF